MNSSSPMTSRTRQIAFRKYAKAQTLKDLLLRDWRAKFISFIIGIAIWAVIKPLVDGKRRYPGKSPGGGSALVVPSAHTPLLTQQE